MQKSLSTEGTLVMPKVIIDGREIEAKPGQTILDAALDNGIEIDHNCGGNCACSTCHIIVEEGMENISEISEDEEDMLDTAPGLTLDSRLACQCRLNGDVKIRIPKKKAI